MVQVTSTKCVLYVTLKQICLILKCIVFAYQIPVKKKNKLISMCVYCIEYVWRYSIWMDPDKYEYLLNLVENIHKIQNFPRDTRFFLVSRCLKWP